tara:strand:- start:423 stop:572 length:150 start_codon:yes stop_codon:yes gene_type:complete
MRYRVIVELSEAIEADSVKDAEEKFLSQFEFADVKNGTWLIEEDDDAKV